MTRNQKQQELNGLQNYWGRRAICQIRYLEQLIEYGHFNDINRLADIATDYIYEQYKANGGIVKSDVLALEEKLKPAEKAAKSISVSCVGHAHIDMNWMWAFDETVMITIETCRTMLMLMKEYPEFTFMQSQASVYKILEEYAPELLPGIKEYICGDQWEVTASTWVETDKNMTNGESLTRHLLYTKRYLKELLSLTDDDFKIDFEPDTFGHTAQTPEILRSGGVEYYYHCRGYDGYSLYKWEAPSGAHITVFREPNWYNDKITGETFLYIPKYCADNKIDRMCHVYGVGDHGGGATRADIECIIDMSKWPCMPALSFGKLIEFFDYLKTVELPVVKHELNFVFDGCYTSQTRIKKANRISEAAFYKAEMMNSFSALFGSYKYDAKAFGKAWENTLFNHFHDILPGSGIIATREYAMGLFQQTMAVTGSRLNASLRGIANEINTSALLPKAEPLQDSMSEGAGAGFAVPEFKYTASAGVTGGENRLFVVFNPIQGEWNGLVEVAVWDWKFPPDRALFKDDKGNILPIQLIDTAPQPYWGHSFFRALIDCQIPAFGYSTILLSANDTAVPVPQIGSMQVDYPETYILENEYVYAELNPITFMLQSLKDKKSGFEYINGNEGGGFFYIEEDDTHGMTSWRVGRYKSRHAVIENARMIHISRGELRQRISFEADIEASKITVDISLDKNSKVLRYNARCYWREIGTHGKGVPHLAFSIPISDTGKFKYDTAFGVSEREPRNSDVPALSYAFVEKETGGLMLVTDSKYGFRCTRDAMSVSLIRSSYDPDNIPEIYDHDFSIGLGVMQNADHITLLTEAQRFCGSLLSTAAVAGDGKLETSGQLLQIQGNAAVSAVKMAEDGSGIIVRLFDLGGEKGNVDLSFIAEPKNAFFVDAHETILPGTVSVIHNQVTAEIGAHSVAAIKIEF